MRISMDALIDSTAPHLVVLLESPTLSHLLGTKSLAATGRMGEEKYLLKSAIPYDRNSFKRVPLDAAQKLAVDEFWIGPEKNQLECKALNAG